MLKTLKPTHQHLILALLLLSFTVLSSRALTGQNLLPISFSTASNAAVLAQANLFLDPSGLLEPIQKEPYADFKLEATFPEQNAKLHEGSQADILRLTLQSNRAFTLRYLPLTVTLTDLAAPEDPKLWKLYAVEDGKIQFDEPRGYAEAQTSTAQGLELRFRLFPNADQPGQGLTHLAGNSQIQPTASALASSPAPLELALVGPLQKSGPNPSLTASFPTQPLSAWEFLPYISPQAWVKIKPWSSPSALNLSSVALTKSL